MPLSLLVREVIRCFQTLINCVTVLVLSQMKMGGSYSNNERFTVEVPNTFLTILTIPSRYCKTTAPTARLHIRWADIRIFAGIQWKREGVA